ncbi:MAG: hypothetical protein R3Y56_00080 [Akkermansia sp.]
MKCLIKTICLLVPVLGSMAPLSMAQSVELPAAVTQLIQKSSKLELKDLVDLVHALTLQNPDAADQILSLVLESRSSWSDLEVASIFSSVVSALPETRDALVKVPEEVQKALETGAIDESKIADSMGVALLNVLAGSPVIADEQRQRLGAVVAHAVTHAGDTAAINRLANGELDDGTLTLDEEVQAKEDPRSHEAVLEEFEDAQDDSDPGDTTSAQ